MNYTFYTSDQKLGLPDLASLEFESKKDKEFKRPIVIYKEKRFLATDPSLISRIDRQTHQKLIRESKDYAFTSWVYGEPIWPMRLEARSDDKSEIDWIVLGRSQSELIGFVKGKVMDFESSNPYARIDYVEVNPRWRGKKQCVPLVETTFQFLSRKYPALEEIILENASTFQDGIPACICYYNASQKASFLMLDPKKDTYSVSRCETNPQNFFSFVKKRG